MFPTSRLYQFGAQEVLTPSRSKLPHPKRGGVFHTNDQTQENTTPATACLEEGRNQSPAGGSEKFVFIQYEQ